MPASTSNPSKRKASTAFKPPRPKSTTTKPVKGGKRKSLPSHQPSSSGDDENDDADMNSSPSASRSASPASPSPSRSSSPQPTTTSTRPNMNKEPPPTIPPKLLTKLIHHHFPNKTTRIDKDAMGVVGKYTETFVREAIARAAYERQLVVQGREERGERVAPGEGFLEVEDLEKLAPQLLLDF